MAGRTSQHCDGRTVSTNHITSQLQHHASSPQAHGTQPPPQMLSGPPVIYDLPGNNDSRLKAPDSGLQILHMQQFGALRMYASPDPATGLARLLRIWIWDVDIGSTAAARPAAC